MFGDGETAYRIPLKKGINEIKLEATLGSLSSLLMEVDDCIAALNSIYMKILMITGPTPDQLRDYQFDKQIPDVLRNLKEQADALEDLYSRYVAITGQNGQEAQTLKKAYLQAREMTDDPDGIAQRFSTFSSNITELGTWLSNAAQQPLEIDYLTVASPDQSLVKKGAGFSVASGLASSSWWPPSCTIMTWWGRLTARGGTCASGWATVPPAVGIRCRCCSAWPAPPSQKIPASPCKSS